MALPRFNPRGELQACPTAASLGGCLLAPAKDQRHGVAQRLKSDFSQYQVLNGMERRFVLRRLCPDEMRSGPESSWILSGGAKWDYAVDDGM